MRTFPLPTVISNSLLVGSLALSAVAPVVAFESAAADEPASSVSFVDRDALSVTDANGWRNPLRSGVNSADVSSADESGDGNSLRDTVTPVSYESEGEAAPGGQFRSPNGLQLRQHTEQTGIFSGVMSGAKSQAKPRPAATFSKPTKFFPSQAGSTATASAQSGSTHAGSGPMPPSTAAHRALSMMPQFRSSAARKQMQSAAGAPASQAQMAARAGSSIPYMAQAPSQQPSARGGAQASYNTAVSAQAYRHGAPPTGAAPTAGRRPFVPNQSSQAMQGRPVNANGGQLSPPALNSSRPAQNMARPVQNSTRPTNPQNTKPRVSAVAPTQPIADPSSPAGLLTQAHQLAESAHNEAEFSQIFAICQQIPANEASAEETAFGRQLAAWSLNRRGQLRARAGNNQAAMSDFELAIRIDAKCWRALHNRGVLLAQAGQFEPAFDDFHQTIELNPKFAKAYANRAALYILAGELEPGLADYERAIELDPKFAVAHRGCGRCCHMLGRTDEALAHLSTAIELAPKDAAALASRGDLLTDLGQYQQASDDYDHALAINPKYADACRGSAWLLATCPDGTIRNPGVALERAQQAVELEHKDDATTLDTLAAAQASVGDYRTALQTIRHAIELAPPSERSVYQDRMQMYRQSRPYRIEPLAGVQQAGYQQ